MDTMRISRLTDRQRLCLRHVHAHMSSKEIATRLGIGPGTVDQHIKAAMLILGVSDRREAAQLLMDYEAATPEGRRDAPSDAALVGASPPDAVLGEILASVRHGLRNVLNFSGRDTKEQFWPYAMFLLILGGTIVFFIIEPPFLIAAMRLKQMAVEQGLNPRQLRHDHPDLLPTFANLPCILILVTLAHLALIAAAIARRLHDWGWKDYWACLPLPIANVALMMRPSIIVGFPTWMGIFGLLYALIRGGAPERIFAANILVGSLLMAAVLGTVPLRTGGVETTLVILDFAGVPVFLLVALRANRIWPIWAAAIMALGVAAHAITLTDPMVMSGLGAMTAAGAYPTFLMLIVGTRNHRRRLKQYGFDLAWTPRRAV